jgi:hypothetical protein
MKMSTSNDIFTDPNLLPVLEAQTPGTDYHSPLGVKRETNKIESESADDSMIAPAATAMLLAQNQAVRSGSVI